MSILDNVRQIGSKASKVAKSVTRSVTGNSESNSESRGSHKDSSPKPVAVNNDFSKLVNISQYLPKKVQRRVLSTTFGKLVPFVGTAGIYYETVTPNEVTVSLNNTKAVQNHIGSVHAVAVTLLAETATGFILGINLPSDRVLLVKSYKVDFYRPISKGQIAATATLTNTQRQYILENPKGDMVIPCTINDRLSDSSREPITVEMTWAWIPKAELEARRNRKSKDKQTTDTNKDS